MKSYVLSFSIRSVMPVTALILSFFLFGINTMWGQKATTTINLVLADVLSIEPGSVANGGTVDFKYDNINDYNSEKTTTVANSLIITFSKPFDLKVKANGENFENGSNVIPVDVLTIRRNESSQLTGTSAPIILSTQDQVLITGADRGSKLNLDLDYIIPQARSSSADILGKPAGIYTQKVTYTLTAI
jgi:hypothetical protein